MSSRSTPRPSTRCPNVMSPAVAPAVARIQLLPKVSEPSVFKQAWNALHDICLGVTEPLLVNPSLPAIDLGELDSNIKCSNKTTVGDFEATVAIEKDVNNNTIVSNEQFVKLKSPRPDQHGQELNSQLEFSPQNLPVPKSNLSTRLSRSRPERNSSAGINIVLEKGELVGTHRSNQAEAVAQEYHALLDGVRYYYPFISRDDSEKTKHKRSQSVQQAAKYLDSNYNYIGNVHRNHDGSLGNYRFETEETLLFHPQIPTQRHNSHYDHAFQTRPAAGQYPFFENGSPPAQELAASRQYPPLQQQSPRHFVQQNEDYLRTITDQLRRINVERQTENQEPAQSFSRNNHDNHTMPEVHNYRSINTTSQSQNQTNCHQNNNVNINLTLALQSQQQDGDVGLYPAIVHASNNDFQNGVSGSFMANTKHRLPKVDSYAQTELMIVQEDDVKNGNPSSNSPISPLYYEPRGISFTPELTSDHQYSDFMNKITSKDLKEKYAASASAASASAAISPIAPSSTMVDGFSGYTGKLFSNTWSNTIDMSKLALNYTGESIKQVLDFTDEIVSNYTTLPDERMELSELEDGEQKLGVSLMGLAGIPSPQRNYIYQTTVENIDAIQDISKGTVDAFTSVVSWLTTEDGKSDFIDKARILAAITSEVDPGSEEWEQFERDLGIFKEAVADAVGTGVETLQTVSRKCSETLLNLISSNSASEQDLAQSKSSSRTRKSIECDFESSKHLAPISEESLETVAWNDRITDEEDASCKLEDDEDSELQSLENIPERPTTRRPSSKPRSKNGESTACKNANLKDTRKSSSRDIKLGMLREALKNKLDDKSPKSDNGFNDNDLSATILEIGNNSVEMIMSPIQFDTSHEMFSELNVSVSPPPPSNLMPANDAFMEADVHSYNYGIASAMASAVESLGSSLINLQKSAVDYFTSASENSNKLENLNGPPPDSDVSHISTFSSLHKKASPKEIENQVSDIQTTPKTPKSRSHSCSSSFSRLPKPVLASTQLQNLKVDNQIERPISSKLTNMEDIETTESTEDFGLSESLLPELDMKENSSKGEISLESDSNFEVIDKDSSESITTERCHETSSGIRTPEKPQIELSELNLQNNTLVKVENGSTPRCETPTRPEIVLSEENAKGVLSIEPTTESCSEERKSDILGLLGRLSPFWPSSLISIELPARSGQKLQELKIVDKQTDKEVPLSELDSEFIFAEKAAESAEKQSKGGDKNNNVARTELAQIQNLNIPCNRDNANNFRHNPRRRPASRIPVRKASVTSYKSCKDNQMEDANEDWKTISLFPPKEVKLSCASLNNPMAISGISRGARSVPPKKFPAKWLAPNGGESSVNGFCKSSPSAKSVASSSTISRVGSRVALPIKLFQRPKLDIIDVDVPMAKPEPPKVYSNSGTTRNASPGNCELATAKRYSSKSSYKQIMHDKKQYFAKNNGVNATPIITPRKVMQKSRTVQGRSTNIQAVKIGQRGNSSTCIGFQSLLDSSKSSNMHHD